MKKIGITQRIDHIGEYGETRDALDINWYSTLEKFDITLVPIPSHESLIFCETIGLDGIILSGGNSLSKFENSVANKLRDRSEKSILDFAIKNNIPTMGVCRGAQFISDYFGASLQKVTGHVGQTHSIEFSNSTSQFGNLPTNAIVNSFHNYSISQLPTCLSIVATSEDGGVEAFEHVTNKIAAILWHPERAPEQSLNLDMIRSFFQLEPIR